MSKITQKEVERIAALARIKLNDKEKIKFTHELDAILGYINKLNEVNTDDVEPIAHITGLENITRSDEPSTKPPAEQAIEAERLIQMAPDKKDNYVKVRAVFNNQES